MHGTGRLAAILVLVCVVTCLPQAMALPSVSSSGRFVVSGSEAAQRGECARWAEDVAANLERLLGHAIPPLRGQPVELVLDTGALSPPSLEVTLARENAGLRRVLTIKTVQPPDVALLQAGVVRLLLAGLVEQRRHEAHLAPVLPDIPDWFALGLAGGLDREQLSAWRAYVLNADATLVNTPLSEIFQWNKMPAGWPGRQGLCALVVDWMLLRTNACERILDGLVKQPALTPDVLAGLLGASSPQHLENEWRLWLQSQELVLRDLGAVTPDMVEKLRDELWLVVATSIQSNGVPVALSPLELVAARHKQPQIKALAADKMAAIQRLTIGAGPEIVAVAAKYVLFFEGIARGSWDMVARHRLKVADAALKDLTKQTLERKAYVDAFEKSLENAPRAGGGAAVTETFPRLEKSRLESYLDEAEKRFDKP